MIQGFSYRASHTHPNDLRRFPHPMRSVMRRLDAKKALIPIRIVLKSDVLDNEIRLLRFPLFPPGDMRFVEMLAKRVYLDAVILRKNKTHHLAFASNQFSQSFTGHQPHNGFLFFGQSPLAMQSSITSTLLLMVAHVELKSERSCTTPTRFSFSQT